MTVSRPEPFLANLSHSPSEAVVLFEPSLPRVAGGERDYGLFGFFSVGTASPFLPSLAGASYRTGRASGPRAIRWSFIVRDIDLLDASAGMDVYLLKRPRPGVDELVGTPAGATTIWPALTSIVSSPTVKVALPSSVTKISS